MAKSENPKGWWRLLLTVLVAGMLLPLSGVAAHARAADEHGAATPAAVLSTIAQYEGVERNNGQEFKGIVQFMPETKLGLWTISEKQYNVTGQTEIRHKYGAIQQGSCVAGEMSSDGSYVRELQSKRDVVCRHGGDDNGGGDEDHDKLYGTLTTVPTGLIGDWVIGTQTVAVDANTELDAKGGKFKPGVFVKVEYVVLDDGSLLAKEIKIVPVARDDDEGEGGPGHGDEYEGIERQAVAFGSIESLPGSGGDGIWEIGGITYTVTAATELEAQHGQIKQGANVRVKYWVDENGNRVAKEIKSMPAAAGGHPPGELKLSGFVRTMPPKAEGFIGSWTVGGVTLLADAGSQFDEDDNLIDVGTFVEVKYRKEGSSRIIVEMAARIVPGGGDDDHIGKVERMDDAPAAAWRIGGRDFAVTDATMVGSIATGDTVLVNSYTAANGDQVATRISDVTLDNLLFLPAASR